MFLEIEITNEYTQEDFYYKIKKVGENNINSLTILSEHIKIIPDLPNLKRIICQFGFIDYIYPMKNLEEIFCHSCKKITKFENFPGLKILSCPFTHISSIPLMEKLELLICLNCPGLKEIPNFPNLKTLICDKDLKIKFYNKNLEVNCKMNTIQHFQGRLYQNMHLMYELLMM